MPSSAPSASDDVLHSLSEKKEPVLTQHLYLTLLCVCVCAFLWGACCCCGGWFAQSEGRDWDNSRAWAELNDFVDD